MKYVFQIFLFIFIIKTGYSQVSRIPYYDNIHFNSAFTVIAETDEKSNYYAVNLDSFKSSFEKAYFNELCFKEPKIVRLDSGNESIAWFKSKKMFAEADINMILSNLKNEAISISTSMSPLQKEEWLNRSGK
jgi:hypothetical protein